MPSLLYHYDGIETCVCLCVCACVHACVRVRVFVWHFREFGRWKVNSLALEREDNGIALPLDPEFMQTIRQLGRRPTFSAITENIIKKYGTHFLLSATLGGIKIELELKYYPYITNNILYIWIKNMHELCIANYSCLEAEEDFFDQLLQCYKGCHKIVLFCFLS